VPSALHANAHRVELCAVSDEAMHDDVGPAVANQDLRHHIAENCTPWQAGGIDDQYLAVSRLVDHVPQNTDAVAIANGADAARESAASTEGQGIAAIFERT